MEHGLEQNGRPGLWGLEQKLSNLLKPVTPDHEFVDSLKMKLTRAPAVLVETSRRKMGLLVVSCGLFAGAFLVWLLRKRWQ